METPFVAIPEYFQKRVEAHPDRTAYAFKLDGKWERRSWTEYAAEVRSFAKALLHIGIEKGDVVAVLSGNRPEWTIADMGTLSTGAASTGIYFTCSAAQIEVLLRDSEASVVVVENNILLDRVLEAVASLETVRRIIHIDPVEDSSDPRVVSWDDFLAAGSAVEENRFASALQAIEPEDLSSLVYTSGTTHLPKGVMLSHGSLVEITKMGLEMIGHPTPDYRLLSYLPLAHVAERGLTLLGPAMQGYCVYFAESIEKLPENLKEVRPSFFLGVPRLWEKVYDAVQSKISALTGVRATLASWAMRQGLEESKLRMSDDTPGYVQAKRHRLAHVLVLDGIVRQLGLDKATTAISGAAPMSRHVLEFFASLGIVIQEVYGLSETGGPASFCRERDARFGTIGKPFTGVEMKLASDGEILIRGANLFDGYQNNPEATAATLVKGWLHSGDLGECDDDGFYTIVGRKKELLITAYGKNIAPRKIEAALKMSPYIDEAVVVGDRQKFIAALLVLNEARVRETLDIREAGILSDHAEVRQLVQLAIDEVNESVSRAESIRNFAVLQRPLTIDEGEYTPTMKLVRYVINRNFENEIRTLFAD